MNRCDKAVTVHGAASAPRSSDARADLEAIRASSHGAGTNGDGRPEAIHSLQRFSETRAASAVSAVHLWADGCRLEVEVPGRDGVIAPEPPDLLRGGGWACSWSMCSASAGGFERVAAGGTRVWAQLASAPLVAPAPAEHSGVGGARSSPNGKPVKARAAAPRRRQALKGSP
jgi:hypothetical protein